MPEAWINDIPLSSPIPIPPLCCCAFCSSWYSCICMTSFRRVWIWGCRHLFTLYNLSNPWLKSPIYAPETFRSSTWFFHGGTRRSSACFCLGYLTDWHAGLEVRAEQQASLVKRRQTGTYRKLGTAAFEIKAQNTCSPCDKKKISQFLGKSFSSTFTNVTKKSNDLVI